MKTWLFFTRSEDWWSLLIRWITRSQWAHMGVGFSLEDGTEWYFEALISHDVSGPRCAGDLERWVRKHRRRAYEMIVLPCDSAASQRVWDECIKLQGVAGYSKKQLLLMYLAMRFGLPVPNDPAKLVCSEFASRAVIMGGVDLREPGSVSHDEVTPGSAYLRAMDLKGKEHG